MRSVIRDLMLLYWQIGRDILVRQAEWDWGTEVIDRLANDFPDMKGFSPRNLKCMRPMAHAWLDAEFVQGVHAQLPRSGEQLGRELDSDDWAGRR